MTDTTNPLYVDARLDSDHHTRLKNAIAVVPQVWHLVGLHADAVSRTMNEIRAVPSLGYEVASCTVDLARGNTAAKGLSSHLLGIAHHPKHALQLGRGCPHEERPLTLCFVALNPNVAPMDA